MVIQLRNLTVAAALNASDYVSGAQQKVSADKSMSMSAGEAAQGITTIRNAASSSATKITQVSDGVERLKRTYVSGYAG
ncbi:hypothetical protein LAV84_21060 [Rhizobium sp. VS19-DR104.2]|uniref:hypothetical protein n=1 Tax=unclassified Rhizobium TaxID=2613769 RepID=UPI001CC38B6A|nr:MULTISPECIES: hypothetical protein [unclassified Rhizobium]MBZ5761783.1 hypothetical protein [Rhizobium sp. VS19-DR96]MBZ5768023.1 hypothetical protein [Rhizobium sp. VS19-DR129.2]MBZ5775371.1 hypothetical protein [Rhizobium sp. VS19-DRK62.2]MBZ5786662.1 hypothetical protein [Rhizobium sp. VS19-DR121]MBZ5803818.1 hypothetical protein [Rhizobium sp. VS19-DR181]